MHLLWTLLILTELDGGGRTWVKPGRFGSFFVLCFLALGGHCLQMLCLPGFGTHANTQNLPYFRAFPASIQEHSPQKCLFFMANTKLPNRPGFALLLVHGRGGVGLLGTHKMSHPKDCLVLNVGEIRTKSSRFKIIF